MYIVAAVPIVNPIAIANVEALLGAVAPDRVLNEPRKRPRKLAIELPGIDLLGDRFDDLGAAAWPVARDPVRVVGSEPMKDAGPAQEIVHQRVDRHQGRTDLTPDWPLLHGWSPAIRLPLQTPRPFSAQ